MIRAALAAGCLCTALPAAAQTAERPPRHAMPGTAVWDMTSQNGDAYRIFVSFPGNEPPPDGWPVLYVLDGNAMFAGFAETRRIMEWRSEGGLIVVGVGYPGDKPYHRRRLYDMSAPFPDPPPPARRRAAQFPSGGREPFLEFLTGKLRREIAARYKIDPDRQALFGHSLGGTFALYALYARPSAFHAIVAASTSWSWNEELFDREHEFVARLKAGKVRRPARLLLVAGDREEEIVDSWDPGAFAARMQPLSAWGLRVRYREYAGEGHMTVPSRAVTDTLRFALARR